ncbi:MAG: CbiX/SirB N-terminal domain-containing protein [Pirellulales bacterium]
MNQNREQTAIIVVDHGSRLQQSNQMLVEVVAAYRQQSGWPIVEPAHMELAEPTIADAFNRCVQQGAQRVIVFPYFLGPGNHSTKDIPRLVAEAAARHSGIGYQVASPIGLHSSVLQVIDDRIDECLQAKWPSASN